MRAHALQQQPQRLALQAPALVQVVRHVTQQAPNVRRRTVASHQPRPARTRRKVALQRLTLFIFMDVSVYLLFSHFLQAAYQMCTMSTLAGAGTTQTVKFCQNVANVYLFIYLFKSFDAQERTARQ